MAEVLRVTENRVRLRDETSLDELAEWFSAFPLNTMDSLLQEVRGWSIASLYVFSCVELALVLISTSPVPCDYVYFFYEQPRKDVKFNRISSHMSNFNKPAEGAPSNDDLRDSGSGPQFSTPNEGEGNLGSKTSSGAKSDLLALDVGHWPRKRILRVFEREIPESAISQLQDWRVLYSGPLWESVSKAAPATSGFNIDMKLKHLGTNEADSALYLVFFCDKKLAKHVRKFVTQGHVVEEMGGQFLPQVVPHDS
ncbi:hypothetical protein LY76DRAFT_602916 [Colletotrichum caudatum]|nr:hypothetical protein LY76DRAFT_602916 [Colletotrichum caudatum]